MFIYHGVPSGIPPLLCHGVPAVRGGCLVPPCGVGTVLATVPGDDHARASTSARPRIKSRRRRPRATRCHCRCLLRWRHIIVCVMRVKASLCEDMEGDRGQYPQGLQEGLGGICRNPPTLLWRRVFPPQAICPHSIPQPLCVPTMSPRTIGHARALCPNSLSLLGLCILPPQGSMSLEQVQP